MNKISGMLLFILSVALATVDGWSACTLSQSPITTVDYECQDGSIRPNYVESVNRFCNSSVQGTVNAEYIMQNNCSNRWVLKECPICNSSSGLGESYFTFYCCDSDCEVDSLVCLQHGDTWTNTGASTCGGYSCKINHCKAADSTWLSTSIAACTGSNNYALVNTDSTCEHVGTCCPNDSIPSGNTCKWRCDSLLTQCNGRAGALFGAVLPDTSVSGEDTTFSYQCFYNCAYSPNPDSTVYLVEGNTVLAGPSDSISDGIKSEWFNSIRSTTGSIYVYDYLSPSASEYVDSIAAMKCVEHLWRCVINNKYVYWYDNQEVPAGCTNIVRVK